MVPSQSADMTWHIEKTVETHPQLLGLQNLGCELVYIGTPGLAVAKV